MDLLKQLMKALLSAFTIVGLGLGIYAALKNVDYFSIRIPDWLMLTLIVFLVFLFFFMAQFLSKNLGGGRESDSAIKAELEEIKKDFAAYRKTVNNLEIDLRGKIAEQGQTIALIYNNPYDHIQLEPTEEILFILGLLAAETEKTLTAKTLNGSYLISYGRDKQIEYNILINKLENYELIRQSGSDYDIPWCEITSKGLEYYERARKKAAS